MSEKEAGHWDSLAHQILTEPQRQCADYCSRCWSRQNHRQERLSYRKFILEWKEKLMKRRDGEGSHA